VHQECTTLGARFTWHSGLANSRFHTLLFGINRLRSDALPHFWTNSHCSEAFVQLLCNQNWSVQKTIQSLVDLPWLNGIFEMFHVDPLPVKLNSLQLQARSLLVRSSAAQLYLSPDTHDAMPRQLINGIGA